MKHLTLIFLLITLVLLEQPRTGNLDGMSKDWTNQTLDGYGDNNIICLEFKHEADSVIITLIDTSTNIETLRQVGNRSILWD